MQRYNFTQNFLFSKCQHFVALQSLSHIRLCDPMDCSMPGFSNTLLNYYKEQKQCIIMSVRKELGLERYIYILCVKRKSTETHGKMQKRIICLNGRCNEINCQNHWDKSLDF